MKKNVPLPAPYEDRIQVRILQTKRVPIWPWWNFPRRRDHFWRFYLNDRSGACIDVQGVRYPLERDRALLVPAGVAFSCHAAPHVQHLYVHFDPFSLPGVLVRRFFPLPIVLPRDPAFTGVARMLDEDLNAQRVQAATCQAKALVFMALGIAFRSLPEAERERWLGFLMGQDMIAWTIQHIEENLSEPLYNGQLAARYGLNRDHFVRKFRARIGQTPAQYILERRVARAAEKLCFSADSIEDIASSCGFENRYYFSRIFTRRMGLGPAAYRRQRALSER
jgi:AraC-like DNA-binding protein